MAHHISVCRESVAAVPDPSIAAGARCRRRTIGYATSLVVSTLAARVGQVGGVSAD
jgi:hypothetical protein